MKTNNNIRRMVMTALFMALVWELLDVAFGFLCAFL